MIASGFKPVGWVAGVGAAALGCYMLSLQVAAERASLAGLDNRIVSARQQIRSLQTELGTRGRIQQLEAWNDQVLALSAPVSGQFVEGQVSLARFDTRLPPQMADTMDVRMASAATRAPVPAPAAPAAAPQPQRAIATASAVTPPALVRQASVQRASLAIPAPAPAAIAAPNRPIAPATSRAAATPERGRAAPLAEARPPSTTAARTGRDTATAERTRLADAGPSQAASRKTPAPTRAAATPTPRSTSLLGERAMRDLRSASRAERGGGTGN